MRAEYSVRLSKKELLMFSELVKSVLALVISFGLKWFFAFIGVDVPPEIFNAIVAGIVLWLLTQLGYGLTIRLLARTALVKRGLI